jgi:tRNA uridine 5-carbamoylmethylation protein Kti12
MEPNKKGKIVCIIGPPCSGKSTLASEVHTRLKKMGHNSVFIGEVASDYIAEYGIPNTPLDQIIIFYKQLNREKMFVDSKDYIICDSSSILNYLYFRSLFKNDLSNKDIASINHIQKEILKNINIYNFIFYVPYIPTKEDDGIRYHKGDEIQKLDKLIKSYIEIENIQHEDLSIIKIDERSSFIIDKIL